MEALKVAGEQPRQGAAAKVPDDRPELLSLPGGVGVERPFLCFGQVPEHLVQLPHDLERGEHVLPGVRGVAPADSCEQLLGHGLAGPEAVENRAAAESAGPQPVMDGAGKVLVQVRAGGGGGLVDGKIGGPGEAEGGAAQRKAVAAVRAKAVPCGARCGA